MYFDYLIITQVIFQVSLGYLFLKSSNMKSLDVWNTACLLPEIFTNLSGYFSPLFWH